LALLFATAAVAKLGRFGGFVAAVRGYGIVPSWAVPAAAVATVLTEVVISVSLVGGLEVSAGLGAAAALLVVFVVADSSALQKQPPPDCGCLGGLLRLRPDWWSVGTNAVLAMAAAVAAAETVGGIPFPTSASEPTSTVVVTWMAASLLVMVYWLSAYARTVGTILDEAHAEGVK